VSQFCNGFCVQVKSAEHDRDKELLSQQAMQITGLETAKSWLERRLNETEVCFTFCFIQQHFGTGIWFNILKQVFKVIW